MKGRTEIREIVASALNCCKSSKRRCRCRNCASQIPILRSSERTGPREMLRCGAAHRPQGRVCPSDLMRQVLRCLPRFRSVGARRARSAIENQSLLPVGGSGFSASVIIRVIVVRFLPIGFAGPKRLHTCSVVKLFQRFDFEILIHHDLPKRTFQHVPAISVAKYDLDLGFANSILVAEGRRNRDASATRRTGSRNARISALP